MRVHAVRWWHQRIGIQVLLVAIAVAFALSACSVITGHTQLEGPNWKLAQYVTGSGLLDVPQSVDVNAIFEDGTVNGNGGCNQYTAPYSVNGSDIHIAGVGATKTACPAPWSTVEAQYFINLTTASRFSVSGGTLTFQDATGTTVLVYQ